MEQENALSTKLPVSVVIPALNEAESIGVVVGEMPWAEIAECIVVDNGSTDGTAGIASAAGARVVTSPRGFGAAMYAGSKAALPTSTVLLFMDGDGSDLIEGMHAVVDPILRDEADFVQGSRLRGRRERGSMLPSQVFAGHLVGWLMKLMYGHRYTDMASFRAIRRSSLEAMQMTEMTYGWNLEMQVKAVTMGLRVKEVPIDFRRRIGGESKVSGSFTASVKTAWRIFAVLLRMRAR